MKFMGDVRAVHYNIHLIPDLSSFDFRGKIKIHLTKTNSTQRVVLNTLDLTIKQVLLDGNQQTELTWEENRGNQELVIFLPNQTKDQFRIMIEYLGEINDKLAGFYRSRYEFEGEEKFCAVTQFQENDARRAFPCIDEPGMKATFEISLTIDQNLVGISNTSIVKEKDIGEGKKVVQFEMTPLMSTYLVFFAVGEFEWIEEKYRDIPVRLITSPGKAEKFGQMGLDFGIKSLQFCEDYFGIEYPLSKLDLIATPDFAAGAMENWGAILFRENALLYYPGITSKANEVQIKITDAHEVSHQWFGNLVSPASWKYVWLNESFATFFSFMVFDHYESEFQIWDYYVNGTTNNALTADGYHETAPIEIEGKSHAAYTVKTIPILYNKGGSVLRQLRAYLGSNDFQKGLRHYLKKHEYDVATSKQLWKALEEVSGKPITTMMEDWVLQLGYPKISVRYKNNSIEVSQQRFTYLKNEYPTKWYVPLTMKYFYEDGSTEEQIELLTTKKSSYTLSEGVKAVKLNVEQTGFYRVQYQKIMLDEFGPLIRKKQLSSLDRWSIENDLYAFLRSGDIELEYYLDYLSNYEKEDNHLPIGSISGHLNSLFTLLEGEAKNKISKVGRIFLENVLERIGYKEQEDEHHTLSILRGGLVVNASKFGSTTVTEFAMGLFEQLKSGQKINANVLPNILQIAARETNDFEWFKEQFDDAKTEVEKIYYGNAMSFFTTPQNIEKIQSLIFEEIPPRNRGGAISILCNNDKAKSSIWEWYLANLDNFEKLHPFIYQGALTQVIVASVDYKDELKKFFEEYVKKNPQVEDPVDKALETMEIRALLKERYN